MATIGNGTRDEFLMLLARTAISLGKENDGLKLKASVVPHLLSTKLVERRKYWMDSSLFHLGEPYSLEYPLLGDEGRAKLVLHLVFDRLEAASVFVHYCRRLIPGELIIFCDKQLLQLDDMRNIDPELFLSTTSLVLFCPGVSGHLEGPMFFGELVSKVIGLTSLPIRLCQEKCYTLKLHGEFSMPRISAEVVDEKTVDLWLDHRQDIFGWKMKFEKCKL